MSLDLVRKIPLSLVFSLNFLAILQSKLKLFANLHFEQKYLKLNFQEERLFLTFGKTIEVNFIKIFNNKFLSNKLDKF